MSLSPAEQRNRFLQAVGGVSHGTLQRLDRYESLLIQWNQNLSLISPATVESIWARHFLDSAQLLPLIPDPGRPVIDLGTGAGFPGLVLAIMGAGQVHLVEHNMRKIAFLRTVSAELGLNVTLHAMKVETVKPFKAGTVTARALKPLGDLIGLGREFLSAGGVALFPKGRRAEEEFADAARDWRMKVERFPSVTDPDSTIFRLSDIARIGA